jgi:3-phosphoshikimate 1-carboxyvinyltransferase
MEKIIVPAKKISAEMRVPGDKSISHRALMIGSIARGSTRARGVAASDDCAYTADAFRAMGINIKTEGDITVIDGKGLKGLSRPSRPIRAGNSGTTMRILPGILAGQDFDTTLTGDEGLNKRPMKRVVGPLRKMGVDISARNGEYPPLDIKGGAVKGAAVKMAVASAQVKSAVLLAGLYSKGTTKVIEEIKSRDHTERMLKYFGAKIKIFRRGVSVRGLKELEARSFEIPGDISSAAFFIAAAALLEGSELKIKGVSVNPTRAGMLKVLSRMGAKIKVVGPRGGFEPSADLVVRGSKMRGTVIRKNEIPSLIDELPAIFVVASLSKGRTVIKGAEELKVKETDRINSMRDNLARMGARFDIKGGDIVITGVGSLRGARLDSFGDHRTCMAMAVAALAARGKSVISGAECVSKSFPQFFDILASVAM